MPTEDKINYQNFETISAKETSVSPESSLEPKKRGFKLKKKKLILVIVLAVSFLILISVGLIILNQQGRTILPTQISPTPTPTPIVEQITNPSPYATDSAVLQTEEELKKLESELQEVDLKETNLTPPVLDLDVNF